jgi:hypothetical protein
MGLFRRKPSARELAMRQLLMTYTGLTPAEIERAIDLQNSLSGRTLIAEEPPLDDGVAVSSYVAVQGRRRYLLDQLFEYAKERKEAQVRAKAEARRGDDGDRES